jgi:hypothetical protein
MTRCQILEKADLYGSYLTFRKDGSSKNKTAIGGFTTILTFLSFFSLLYVFSIDIIYKHHPTIMIEKLYQPDQARIDLSKANELFFGFTLCKFNNEDKCIFQLDERVVKIQILLITVTTENHRKSYVTKDLGYRKCKETDIHENVRDQFRKDGLQEAYCIDNKEVAIYGQFESEVFNYVRILVKKCEGSNCLPDDELDKELNKHRVSFFYSFGLEQPKDFEDNYNIQLKNFGGAMSTRFYRRTELYISQNYIKDDLNLLFKASDSFSRETKINSFDFKNYELEEDPDKFFGVYLRTSPMTVNTYRYYKKLPTALSEVMAVIKYMFFFVHMVLDIINYDLLRQNIIRHFLELSDNERQNIDTKLNQNQIEPVRKPSLISIQTYKSKLVDKNVKVPKSYFFCKRICCCKTSNRWEAYKFLVEKSERLLSIETYFRLVQEYIVKNYENKCFNKYLDGEGDRPPVFDAKPQDYEKQRIKTVDDSRHSLNDSDLVNRLP